MTYTPIPADVETVARECINAGIEVHRHLGPGFREVVYERAFCLELNSRGVEFEAEKRILVPYKSWMIAGQKIDLIVQGKVLIELKAVPRPRLLREGLKRVAL